MRYAIIAAGEGSRLAQEGITAPKPLVRIGGEHLLDRLIRVFMDNDAEEIVVICNDQTTLVSQHLALLQKQGLKKNEGIDRGESENVAISESEGMTLNSEAVCRPLPLRYKVKSTPSSMHSFYELSEWLGNGTEPNNGNGAQQGSPFILTTVDTIFREDDFRQYVQAFRQAVDSGTADGLMGVTDHIDDEKPLHVAVDSNMNITAFLDNTTTPHFISGGIYGLTPKALDTLRRCMENGTHRMRNFQRALVSDGLRLKAWPFTKVLDIDHATDITKAENFINQQT